MDFYDWYFLGFFAINSIAKKELKNIKKPL